MYFNQLSWAIKHPFTSLSFKYHSFGCIPSSITLAPVISSLDFRRDLLNFFVNWICIVSVFSCSIETTVNLTKWWEQFRVLTRQRIVQVAATMTVPLLK